MGIMDDQTIQAHLDGLERMIPPEWSLYDLPHHDDLAGRFDSMRVHIKYLRFDVEACRRENQYLRQIIEKKG